MTARRGIGTSRAVGSRTAPDALVAARTVPVQSIRAVRTSVSVARRATPFTVLLVVTMLVKTIRAVCAPVPVARRTAMSAFCRHVCFPFAAYYSKPILPAPYSRMSQILYNSAYGGSGTGWEPVLQNAMATLQAAKAVVASGRRRRGRSERRARRPWRRSCTSRSWRRRT